MLKRIGRKKKDDQLQKVRSYVAIADAAVTSRKRLPHRRMRLLTSHFQTNLRSVYLGLLWKQLFILRHNMNLYCSEFC